MFKPEQPGRTFRFHVGLWLVVGGMFSGVPGACLGTLVGMLAGRPVAGVVTGVVLYLLSWLMIGAGIVLAGPETLVRTRRIMLSLRKKFAPKDRREHPAHNDGPPT